MDEYQKKLGFLADKIKKEPPQIPVQQVQPVTELIIPVEQGESRFNNWIPRELKRRIKAYGVQHDLSQKDITIQALKNYLKDNDRH